MRGTPKLIMTLAMTLILGALFSACGSNASPTASGASPSAVSSPAQADGQEEAKEEEQQSEPATRIFKDYLDREVEIPTHPKRIIVDQFMGHLLAVGVKPIAAATPQISQFENSSFLKPLGLIEGVEDVGSPISLEKVLSLEPDLIIVQDNNAANKDTLAEFSKIAPTVVLSYGSKSMFDQLKEIADIAGVSEKADEWIAQYQEKGEQYRKQLAEVIDPDTTFTVMEFWPSSQIEIFGNLFGRGTFNLYNTLQLKAPPKVQEAVMDKEPSYLAASLETLPDYVGDYIFLTIYDWQNGDNDKLAAELENAPVWRSLPAVKEDRVIQVNVDDFLPGDPISIGKQMEEQVRLLLEKFGKAAK
ncbi:ABC transporter substrate-binding protein [Cohnella cellulosilytica]